MKSIKATYPIKTGEKFGTFNVTDNFVETHHQTEKAAKRNVSSRQKSWGKDKKFEVVIIK